jgi:hypothetical protein
MSTPNPNPDPPKPEIKELPDIALHLVEIELQKDPVLGFGFNIIGGVDEPHIPGHPGIFISRINPEGPAAKDGRFRLGDRIAALNDISLTYKTHSEAVDIFRQASGKVKLLIEQDAETLLLSAPCSVFATPVTDSPVQETLRLSILKSNSKTSTLPGDTVIKTPSGSPQKTEITMVAAISPADVSVNPSFQLDKPIADPEATLSSNENGTVVQRTRRQSFREPLVTLQPLEAEQRKPSEAEQRKPPEPSSTQNHVPTVVFPIKAVPVEEEEDRASTISVAPSVYSVIDDVPRTPKKPSSWFDPSSPSLVTEAIFISIGAISLGLSIAFAVRYFRNRR